VTSCALVTEETGEPGEGRYFLRDLAGLADIERLLATDVIRERRSPDVADDDASGDSAMMSGAPRPRPGGGSRR